MKEKRGKKKKTKERKKAKGKETKPLKNPSTSSKLRSTPSVTTTSNPPIFGTTPKLSPSLLPSLFFFHESFAFKFSIQIKK
jgi:hypothetical protein